MPRKVNSENYPRVAYGLDLAGYSQGKKSALVRVEWPGKGPVKAKVLAGHPFAQALKGKCKLDPKREQEGIARILEEGNLCVDVPIDLQGLMGLDAPERRGCLPRFVSHTKEQDGRLDRSVWQLTKRPVDYAFGGLAPLASFIGHLVVRFRTILAADQRDQLGLGLWETYPGAVLHKMWKLQEECPEEYRKKNKINYKKDEVTHDGAEWKGNGLAWIANTLGIKPVCPAEFAQEPLSDDELDAVLCALPGVAPSCESLRCSELDSEIARRLPERLPSEEKSEASQMTVTAPTGYVLLRKKREEPEKWWWNEIHLERAEWKLDIQK